MAYLIKDIKEIEKHPYYIAKKLYQIAYNAYKWGSPWEISQFHETIRYTRTTFIKVAVDQESDKWCGFILGNHVVDTYDIYMLAVDEKFQNQGIGSALIECIQKEAQKSQHKMTLEVRVSNQTARHVYEGHDFKIASEITNYYKRPTENALRMWWQPESK